MLQGNAKHLNKFKNKLETHMLLGQSKEVIETNINRRKPSGLSREKKPLWFYLMQTSCHFKVLQLINDRTQAIEIALKRSKITFNQ
jgi:hypothetical protein